MIKNDIKPGITKNGINVLMKAGVKYDKCKSVYWTCQCHCGKIFDTKSTRLRQGIKSCGCDAYRKGKDSPHWTGHGGISGKLWARIELNAKDRRLEFSITKEYCWELFLKQDAKCAISGIALSLPKDGSDFNKFEWNASIDRIDSSKGYTKSNIQWVDKRINMMKQNLTMKDFLDLCEKITKRNRP